MLSRLVTSPPPRFDSMSSIDSDVDAELAGAKSSHLGSRRISIRRLIFTSTCCIGVLWLLRLALANYRSQQWLVEEMNSAHPVGFAKQPPSPSLEWSSDLASKILPTDLEESKEIPNIVHFVRQANRDHDGRQRPFRVEFRHLMAYYSASYYLKPDHIYMWSDVDKEALEEAKTYGDEFTKALFRLPNLSFEYVEFPNTTVNGVEITQYAHKSDFVRTRVMANYGGQYFDDDAWLIRDLAPLRSAGFDNVFGKEAVGDLCQAMWIARPHNDLMQAWVRLQESEFTGDWLRASNELLLNLVKLFARTGNDQHALVLEQDAFFPGQWWGQNGLEMFYMVHDEDPQWDEPHLAMTVDEIVAAYDYEFNMKGFGWRKDWRKTYVIHGFSNALRADQHLRSTVFGEFGGFTPDYILSRRSNIGRALYPALRNAIDSGFLNLS